MTRQRSRCGGLAEDNLGGRRLYYVSMYVDLSLSLSLRICVYIYIYVYVYTYICIYKYTLLHHIM